VDSGRGRKKILLVNPWIADFAAYDLWSKPIGLLYVGKFLRRYGYDVSLLDLTDRCKWGGIKDKRFIDGRGKYFKTEIPKPEPVRFVPRKYGLYGAKKEDVINELTRIDKPDAVLITSVMTYWYPGIINTIELLREVTGEVKIILGGIYATLFESHARSCINPDYIVTGYGEKKALRILDSMFDIKRDYSGIPDFDDRGMLPWELYDRIDYAVILTSRGCPYRCSYCATGKLNPSFYRRPTEDVIEEIMFVKEKFGVRDFVFYDDALFYDRENYIIPLLSELVRRNPGVRFHTPNGLFVKEIDEVISRLMFESGFKTIRLSVESISSEFLGRSSYKVNRAAVERAVNNLVRAGYRHSELEAYLLVGLPGQRYGDVVDSLKFMADLGVISRLSYYSPIPGTRDWEVLRQKGVMDDSSDPLLTNNTVYMYVNKELNWEEIAEIKVLASEYNNKIRVGNGVIHGNN